MYRDYFYCGGGGTKIAAMKGLRLCPLVLTVKVAGGEVERLEASKGK